MSVRPRPLSDLRAIPGQDERPGDLPLDEARDRPVVVLHALEVDAQPDRAVMGVVAGVPLDTLVAVRDAHDAAGWAAEVASAALEDVSEEGLQGVGGVVSVRKGAPTGRLSSIPCASM